MHLLRRAGGQLGSGRPGQRRRWAGQRAAVGPGPLVEAGGGLGGGLRRRRWLQLVRPRGRGHRGAQRRDLRRLGDELQGDQRHQPEGLRHARRAGLHPAPAGSAAQAAPDGAARRRRRRRAAQLELEQGLARLQPARRGLLAEGRGEPGPASNVHLARPGPGPDRALPAGRRGRRGEGAGDRRAGGPAGGGGMIKLLNAGQLASIPSAPVRFQSRINGDQLAWFYGVNYSPYLFEVLDDSGLVRGVLPPGEKVIPLQVRSEYLVLNPVATILSTPVVPASAWAVYVDVSEQEPEVAMLLGTVPSEAASVSTTGGAIAGQAGLEAAASEGYLWNGASWVPASSPSPPHLAAQSGPRVHLSAPPREGALPSHPGLGNGAPPAPPARRPRRPPR